MYAQGCLGSESDDECSEVMVTFDLQMVELNPEIHFPAASENHVFSSYSQHLHFQN